MTDLTVDGQFDIAVAESLVLEVRTFFLDGPERYLVWSNRSSDLSKSHRRLEPSRKKKVITPRRKYSTAQPTEASERRHQRELHNDMRVSVEITRLR